MQQIRKLAVFLKPYWRWVLIAPLLMLLEVTMDLLQPQMIRRIVDDGIAALDMAVVTRTGLTMVGLAIVGAVGGLGNTFLAVKTSESFGADLREALFRKVQSFSFGNLDALETGGLVTRLTNDVTQVQQVLQTMLRILVRAPLLLVGSLVMAAVTSPQLAVLLLALLPVELVAVVWVVRKATPMYAIVQTRLDGLNQVLQENLAGVRVVKAFVRADHEVERFDKANDRLVETSIKVARIAAAVMPIMMFTINVGLVGALWFGGIQVQSGGMTVGQIIAFTNYLLTSLFSLMMVSMLVIQVARAQASALRIQEIFDVEPTVQNKPQDVGDMDHNGRVVFEQVDFGYDHDDGDHALRGISFVAEPGQTVAILGTTGSGKSTLVSLIPRFYDVSSGRVTLDGVDVRDMDTAVLRRQVVMALQETVLFSGTIRDNICYGFPEATDYQVVAAAKMAQAHEFITALPQGYDTQLGQRGVNLSGGQKQRLAIARALLTRPAVLILDDSTSSVDVETEARIQDALQEYAHQMTCLVIAQRISTVLAADKILVLDDGHIAAEGSHGELMQSSPIYREIYESQLGNGAVSHG